MTLRAERGGCTYRWHPLTLTTGNKQDYINSTRLALQLSLERMFPNAEDRRTLTVTDVSARVHEMNRYPNLDNLRMTPKPGEISIIDSQVDTSQKGRIVGMLEKGLSITMHTAAGEATRMGLGPKALFTGEKLISVAKEESTGNEEMQREMKQFEKMVSHVDANLQSKRNGVSLGARHMLALAFRLRNIARENGLDPDAMLKSAPNLVIVPEGHESKVIDDFISWDFFGFDREKTYFYVQENYHGFSLKNGMPFYDESSAKRTNNHGGMAMEALIGTPIFTIGEDGKIRIPARPLVDILESAEHMIAYNIEDIKYLHSSFDYPAFAVALQMGDEGFRKVMELVGQSDPPQKGGAWAYDDLADRGVVIESDQFGIPSSNKDVLKRFLEKIKLLNKNFNQWLEPRIAFASMREHSLPSTHWDVKGDEKKLIPGEWIYPQTVQGDICHIVPTGFFRREVLEPIAALKERRHIPTALIAMHEQDMQEGFLEFAQFFWDKGRHV